MASTRVTWTAIGCTGPPKLGAALWPVPQLESPGSYFRSTWGVLDQRNYVGRFGRFGDPDMGVRKREFDSSGRFGSSERSRAADFIESWIESNKRVGRSHGKLCEARTSTQRA